VESDTRYHPSPDQLALASRVEGSLSPALGRQLADPHLSPKRAQLLIALAGGLKAANLHIAEAGAWQ
jgi:hypothetical protein